MAARKTSATAATNGGGKIQCPTCKADMVPMTKGGGFRCSRAGRFDPQSRKWSGCNGVVWNNSKPFVPVRDKAPRATAFPVISRPTDEQKAIRAHLAKAPSVRGGRCTIIDAGPGTGKTSTLAWSAEAEYERLGSLKCFPKLAFNGNARDVLSEKMPVEVPDVYTINGWCAQAQGYRSAQYDAGKVRKIFKSFVEHIPYDERPNAGCTPKLIERMRDLCFYHNDASDMSWWQSAINATLDRFPSMAKDYVAFAEVVNEYLPRLTVQAFGESGKIDIQEQVTRPVSEACARTGWRMPFDLPSKPADEWTADDVAHFAKLIRSIRLPEARGMTIDEGQDLSLCQIAVLLAQVWRTGELVVIGDDCEGKPGDDDYKAGQAIYGWRGAFGGSLSLIARLWAELTGETATRLYLTVTFRHGNEICEGYRNLNRRITSIHPPGYSQAWCVSAGQAWKVWLDLPENETALWITRTNAPLAPMFLDTLKAHCEVTLRGGADFGGQIDNVLYGCAGWYNEQGEYQTGWVAALAQLRINIAEDEQDNNGKPDPNSMLRFVLTIAEALEKRPALFDKANLTDRALTVGNLRRFILYFADRKSRRVLTNVYRCKGDEATVCVVDDAGRFNETWGNSQEDAACRHVALSRGIRLLLTIGDIAGSTVDHAPVEDYPEYVEENGESADLMTYRQDM